jgi:transglutaminase/protease-like cytokinesis protein 3
MKKSNNLSSGQKAIVTVGAFVITFITICTFFKSDIKFLVTSKKIEREYGKTQENSYFLEDNFEYVENFTKSEVNSKKEIINSIYYLINSGETHSKKYCGKEYTECYNDMTEISNDTDLLSLLNNFVHPFNSFDSMTFDFDNNVIEITINHTYSKEEIDKLNTKVDEIINENIKDTMSARDKIKTIHDYIINNTDYDTLKTDNANDTTYKSNTAYGVLFENYGICSGYSDAMALFLNKLNFINYKISNDQHIWNLVYLDGEWLHLDLTWDDPVSEINITRDNYFLITTNTLNLLDDKVHYYNDNIFSETKNN